MKPAIEGRCADIRKQIEKTTSDYDKEKLQERLAKLAGGVAVIRVGAPSEAEMKIVKRRSKTRSVRRRRRLQRNRARRRFSTLAPYRCCERRKIDSLRR